MPLWLLRSIVIEDSPHPQHLRSEREMGIVDLRDRVDTAEVRQLLAVLAWTGTTEHLDRICSR